MTDLTPRPIVKVVRLLHSAVPLVAMLAVLPLHIGVMCGGWQATAEARLECCASGGDCGMHDTAVAGSSAVTTQLEADQCCAASESDDSRAAESAFALSVSAAVLGTATAAPDSQASSLFSQGWRLTAALPPGRVSRHVLLSVFLV